nr:hypothetical protein [Micromonospora sp. M42]
MSRIRSQQGLAAVGATLLGYAVMVLSGVLGLVVPFAVAAVVAFAGELALAGRHTPTAELLDKAGLGETFRQLVRDLSVVLLVVVSARPGVAGTIAVLLLPAALWTVAVATNAVTKVIDGRVDPPAYTRNIDLGALRRVPVPPAWARWLAGLNMPLLNVLLVPAAVVAAARDQVAPVVVTGLVTLAAGLVTAAVLALTALRGRGSQPGVLPAVHDWMPGNARGRALLRRPGQRTSTRPTCGSPRWRRPAAARWFCCAPLTRSSSSPTPGCRSSACRPASTS